mgnify:CR=1 FL=1
MIVLAIILATTLASSLGVVAWLVYGRLTDARLVADERVAHTATNGKLERAQFELEATKVALVEQKHVTDGLEDVLASYINTTPNSDLARGDVLGRLLRAARKQAEADRNHPVPAVSTAAVPETPASERPGTALMRPDD